MTDNGNEINLILEKCKLFNTNITGEGYRSLLQINRCIGYGVNIHISTKLELISTKIQNNNNESIIVGAVNMSCSHISGNNQQIGLEIRGSLDNINRIVQSSIYNFNIGILYTHPHANLSITNTNLYRNTQYYIYNTSPKDILAENNWWTKNTKNVIKTTIHDYYQNINYGKIFFKNFSTSKIINNEC